MLTDEAKLFRKPSINRLEFRFVMQETFISKQGLNALMKISRKSFVCPTETWAVPRFKVLNFLSCVITKDFW